jgi:hypothetical protein
MLHIHAELKTRAGGASDSNTLTRATPCRYFVIPTLIALLHAPLAEPAAARACAREGDASLQQQQQKAAVLQQGALRRNVSCLPNFLPEVLLLLGYLCVNCACVYVYLYRTFTWPDGSVARFMW